MTIVNNYISNNFPLEIFYLNFILTSSFKISGTTLSNYKI